MGTYYTTGATKADIIRELTENYTGGFGTTTTLKKCIKGNVLWTVKKKSFIGNDGNECILQQPWIGCYLLSFHDGNWGYKPLDERMHPYYYNCPLSYLDMCEVECQEWRDKVRDHHKQNNVGRKFEVGKYYAIKGYTQVAKIIDLKPLTILFGGSEFKVSRKMIGQEIQ